MKQVMAIFENANVIEVNLDGEWVKWCALSAGNGYDDVSKLKRFHKVCPRVAKRFKGESFHLLAKLFVHDSVLIAKGKTINK